MLMHGGALLEGTDSGPVDRCLDRCAVDDRLPATPAPGGSDPLAAFLDGLHGLSSDASWVSPWGAGRAPVTLLSNGFNADAGVAQLVSALASLPDANSAFGATPFAAPSDQGSQGVIAPEAQ